MDVGRPHEASLEGPLLAELLEAIATRSLRHLLAEPGSDGPITESLTRLGAAADLTVTWVGVNEPRVDVGLISPSADAEWRLVYFLTADRRLSSVHIYERPPFFGGLVGGRAVVVNGPSGAGKSTLMTAILDSSPEPWVMFDEPVLGQVARQSYLIWRDRAPTLHRGYFRAIAALAAEGNQVVLSAAGFPFPHLRDAFRDIDTRYIGLDCPLEVLLRREAGRDGRWGGLAERSLKDHEGWTYDARFDSSVEPAAAMAAKTLALFGGGAH